ncbi:myeloid cell surface antigen CD33 isoform X4 [Pipistrellus kuhlii]|uniref:myeloid cell surface antigen CD33 isoform X4 n=1 Tax=Pipistrellus kuhlii TaxID=59472 RepID=UPI001E273986|nr:myeloid cell surface antigen CD33 isoform X4 [Pipistrellus kuhlii]
MLWLLLPLLWAGSMAQDSRYTLHMQSTVTVQEGLCVHVTCKVFYSYEGWDVSTPAHGYWYKGETHENKVLVATNNPDPKLQEETQGRFHLRGDPRTYNCSLDIRDARRTDEGLYYFRLERGGTAKYSYLENKLSVRVTALNHTPHILTPETLESGRPRNLTCSVPWACERGTPPTFSWTSAAHSSLGPRTHLSSMLTLTPRPQDHGTYLTCQVHFPAAGVTVERTIQLNVTCPPQNPTPGGCLGDGAGELRTKADVVQAAVAGAGITALLAGCLCLIYFVVKTRRKKARAAMGMDNIHPATGPASLGQQKTPESDSLADSTSPAGATPALRVEPDVYYASIRFKEKKPPQTSPESEYANVRTH